MQLFLNIMSFLQVLEKWENDFPYNILFLDFVMRFTVQFDDNVYTYIYLYMYVYNI